MKRSRRVGGRGGEEKEEGGRRKEETKRGRKDSQIFFCLWSLEKLTGILTCAHTWRASHHGPVGSIFFPFFFTDRPIFPLRPLFVFVLVYFLIVAC
ncbi:MAG: hypothetical protein JOS17DRAFT_756148 [Linnemannia elongata]|nr:MAG: hypothetical protein JOS17DRAFT_756148 [Linnemannia elongata]